jgi:acyl carrier protein
VNASVLAQVQGLAADIFNVSRDEVGPAASPATIVQWDSLQHLSLVLAIEEHFNLELVPEEIEQMGTIELVTRIVENKLRL